MFKKKKVLALIAMIVLYNMLLGSAQAYATDVSAASAILVDGQGTVLFEKNPDRQMLIASTTKIMTAIVTVENRSLEECVEIKDEYCRVEGTSMYLKPGERYSVGELLTGLMLSSGNDAALALAGSFPGGSEAFVAKMNEKAAGLGMYGSSFSNPHGLDAPEHYSTARDMAVLMLYCMENSTFAKRCSLKSAEIKGQYYVNHNKLLGMYAYCIGGKTGYTMAAGRCLVSCCEKDGERLVCVTLSAPDDWNDHIKLYNSVYNN